MKTRLLLTCLAVAAMTTLTGCDKVQKMLRLKPAETVTVEPAAAETAGNPEAAAAPAAAVPAAEAAPTPEPTPQGANRSASVVVLCYHRFEEPAKDALAITPAEFEAQLQAIKDAGAQVIGMQDFLAWRKGEKAIPERSVVITIDDGYISGYNVAWPLLKKFEYPFTMFVYIEYIGIGGKAISWDQLAEMRDGGVDIQSHTYTHQDLRGRGVIRKASAAEIKKIGYDAWVKNETAGSKEALENRLGILVNTLAYPYGNHNEAAQAAVKNAGYDAAFTVYGQRVGFGGDPFRIGRYAISSKEPQIFTAALKALDSGPTAADSAGPAIAQMAAASMATQPMQGETISNNKPALKANLATMGTIEPGSVEMRVSGLGVVAATYDEATKTLSFQPSEPLADKQYTVIVSARVGGRKVETSWHFYVNTSGAATPAAAQ